MVYRTPRAQAAQSVFTEDLDYGHVGVVLGGHHSLSAWLYERLSGGELLHRAPWSSSLNPGRLADAYAASGFVLTALASAGAARDGLDVTDLLACEVLHLPCDDRGRAAWSRYGARRTYESGFDSLAHSVGVALPHAMRVLGCRPPEGAGAPPPRERGTTSSLELPGLGIREAKEEMLRLGAAAAEVRRDGAATHCYTP